MISKLGNNVSESWHVIQELFHNVFGLSRLAGELSDNVSESSDDVRELSDDVSKVLDEVSRLGNFVGKSLRIMFQIAIGRGREVLLFGHQSGSGYWRRTTNHNPGHDLGQL